MLPISEILEQQGVMALLLQQVNCIDRAYKDALENFREDAGSDGRTFGMDVYTFTWFQIRESKSVEITKNEPFWFSLNGASVACHKVGKDLKRLFRLSGGKIAVQASMA